MIGTRQSQCNSSEGLKSSINDDERDSSPGKSSQKEMGMRDEG